MAGRLVLLAMALALLAGATLADAPKKSPRPMPRPATLLAAQSDLVAAPAPQPATVTDLRPRPRPARLVASAAAPVVYPEPRPEGLAENAGKARKKGGGLFRAATVKSNPGKAAVTSKKGSICGDPAIKGEALAPITSRVKGCGVPDAVRVTSVSGVRLSQAATIDCPTARALKTWVDKGVQPAFGKTSVVELKVAAHYICRPRNNVKGAKVSEHGRGKAIDISGFVLSDGTVLSVLGNYNARMRKAYKAACGPFGTTLGPGSDGYHEDHLHLDTASHRSGPYCR